jgi:hypothetical protein
MSDDAQRTLEQRSLRNVRSLLDKLERDADREKRTRRIIGWALAAALVLVCAGFFAYLKSTHERVPAQIILTPAQR